MEYIDIYSLKKIRIQTNKQTIWISIVTNLFEDQFHIYVYKERKYTCVCVLTIIKYFNAQKKKG